MRNYCIEPFFKNSQIKMANTPGREAQYKFSKIKSFETKKNRQSDDLYLIILGGQGVI